jgi:hypothetical protein
VVACIENATEHKAIALGAFLDIEELSIEPHLTQWNGLLKGTVLSPQYAEESVLCWKAGEQLLHCQERPWERLWPGGPQGGVLSPLLWGLVVDDLLWELNDSGYYTVGYADDIAIQINGELPQTVLEVLRTALCTVQQWCEWTNLSMNADKNVVIPFTRKRNMKGLKKPTLFSKRIQLFSVTSTLE